MCHLPRAPTRLLCCLAILLLAGFWASAPAYEVARPGRKFMFPRDFASHPRYQTEWWYYTGHLTADDGRRYGYELTFFRAGIDGPPRRSAWATHDLYFAHLALTDEGAGRFRFWEKSGRGVLGLSGALTSRYRVWIGDWSAELAGSTHRLAAEAPGLRLALALTPAKPPVINGENGISQKAAGASHATYYVSLTRLLATGTLTWAGRQMRVHGLSWMDHEFGTNQLAPGQVGWDWFSLQLSDGRDVMLYLMRRQDGSIDPYSSGTLVEASGRATHLKRSAFSVTPLAQWRSPATGALYPARWRVRIPAAGLDVTVTPTVADQELRTTQSTGVTYWEGSCRVSGTDRARPVSGDAYVELTGYAGRVRLSG